MFLLALCLLVPVSAQEDEEKPVLSVLDFTATGISAAEAKVFTDVLSTYIVRTGTCQLIDRKQRETILEHIEFSYSQCADESCQLEIGRLLSASQLVVGSIGQIGGWLVVTVRLVDVPTGQTLGSVSEKYLSLEALIDAIAALAH